LAWEQLNITARITAAKPTVPATFMLLTPSYPRELTAEALRAQSWKKFEVRNSNFQIFLCKLRVSVVK
jgi:hypothetical protein